MPPRILLGRSDFISLREAGHLYVDKSGFVAEILEVPAEVALYPRPRRFGKTLNLSMAQAFFEKGPDRSALFSDLSIWQDAEARRHFQRYPVIKLTFKDVKQRSWADAKAVIAQVLSSEVERHQVALKDPRVPPALRARLTEVWLQGGDAEAVLLDLCQVLSIHHGEKVVLLIDEYDAPVLNGWEHGHYDEAVARMRGLLSPGLKDNPWLFRGVLTGILRVARESMFSGLNNVRVYSLLSTRARELFGFTEQEVAGLLAAFGRSEETSVVRSWYNGYRFGDTTVYNPWSILNFLADPGEPPAPYWLNTSENGLVRSLLLENPSLHEDITTLLAGGAIERVIDENVTLRELSGDAIWSLFLFGGYLRADKNHMEEGIRYVTLSVPNLEVSLVWRSTFRDWIRDRSGGLDPLHKAILSGDAPRTQGLLSNMLLRHTSAHDVAQHHDEVFYHAFVLGLLVTLERTHRVRSNQESGLGRADVLLIPKSPGGVGVVMAFKRRLKSGSLEAAAAEALRQIQDRRYDTELSAAGASPIRRLGIAFSGKEVAVVGEGVVGEG